MTHQNTDPGPLRLDVLAALAGFDAPASRAADTWVHADGTPYSAAEANLLDSATTAEWEIAEALRCGPEEVSDPDAPALARLLRLASGTPLAGALAAGLRQAFPPPDDSPRPLARGERTAAFAGIYQRLALPGMTGDALHQATAILASLAHEAGQAGR